MTNYKLEEFKQWLNKQPEKNLPYWSYLDQGDYFEWLIKAVEGNSVSNAWSSEVHRPYREIFQKWAVELDQAKEFNNNQLQQLFQLIFPNQPYSFFQLQQEIARLRNKELAPQVRKERAELEQLITTAKTKAGNNFATIIDLLLQSNKEKNTEFAQGQLAAYKNILQGHLTDEETQSLLNKQREVLELEKQLTQLQTRDLTEKNQIQVNSDKWLREIFCAFLPNQAYDFAELKKEMKRLKLDDLSPEVKTEKDGLEKLITSSKSKVSSHSEKVFESFLQTQKRAIEQKE